MARSTGREISRRGFLALAGGLAGGLLAGCSTTGQQPATTAEVERQTVYDTPAESAEAAPAASAAAPADVSVLMVGDILVHRPVWQSGEREDGTRNYDHIFANVADDVSAADIAMLDQETILGGDAFGISGYPSFNSPQEFADAEVAAGFDVALHANNHALDMGLAGIEADLAYWREHFPEMLVTGIADSEEAAAVIPIIERSGHKIAILNYTADTNGIPLPSDAPWAVRMLEESQVEADFAAAKDAGAEAILVCPHWGEEYAAEPNDHQTSWAQVFADLGATAILGNHPHVLQPYDLVTSADGRHVPTYWSLGNFVSNQDAKQTMIGGMARLTLRFEGGDCAVTSAGLTPIVTNKAGSSTLSTYKLADYTEEQAAGNGVRYLSGNEDFSRQWCVDFCAERLGEGFDTETCEFTGEV